MSDEDSKSAPNDKEGSVDQNRNPLGNSWDAKVVHANSPSTSTSACLFDWSPHADMNDFMRKLNFWIWECQQWKHFHAQYPALSLASNNRVGSPPRAGTFPFATLNGNQNRPAGARINANIDGTGSGTVYTIPRVWKRVAAEMIDCIILLLLKITLLSMLLTEFVQLQNLEDIKSILMEDDNLKTFNLIMYEHSAEMVVIAIIHRIIVCVYETYSLYAYPNPTVGGATLGKMMLGLRVVSCTSIEDLGNGRVRVLPAGNIGLANSLMRAVIKNSSIVFFVPACFTIFSSQYNRTAYDFVCGCIVVENIPT